MHKFPLKMGYSGEMFFKKLLRVILVCFIFLLHQKGLNRILIYFFIFMFTVKAKVLISVIIALSAYGRSLVGGWEAFCGVMFLIIFTSLFLFTARNILFRNSVTGSSGQLASFFIFLFEVRIISLNVFEKQLKKYLILILKFSIIKYLLSNSIIANNSQ